MLYIPIWFYSNRSQGAYKTEQYTCLYIPIWFYSNWTCIHVKIIYYCLYIPIWFYSNCIVLKLSALRHFTLHSNLVLFKSVHIIPPIYTAWKALFCRPINKWFLQWRYFYNLSLFSPSKPLFITFVDLPIFYSYIRSTTYFI